MMMFKFRRSLPQLSPRSFFPLRVLGVPRHSLGQSLHVKAPSDPIRVLGDMKLTGMFKGSRKFRLSDPPIEKLKYCFKETMKDGSKYAKRLGKIPLFASSEVYLNTLICRCVKGDLADHPWLVKDEDFVQLLPSFEKMERSNVWFMTATAGSGKTAAVINLAANCNHIVHPAKKRYFGIDIPKVKPVFLLSLPFNNNGDAHFSISSLMVDRLLSKEENDVSVAQDYLKTFTDATTLPTKDMDKAQQKLSAAEAKLGEKSERIGGWFMHFCLKTLLEEATTKGEFDMEVYRKYEAEGKEADKLMKELLEKHDIQDIPFLVNVDEHKKISDNPHLRRGAMKVLSKQKNLVVIATFVEPITSDVLSSDSSGTCRAPLRMPMPCQWKLMQHHHSELLLKVVRKVAKVFKDNEKGKEIALSQIATALSQLAVLSHLEWCGDIQKGKKYIMNPTDSRFSSALGEMLIALLSRIGSTGSNEISLLDSLGVGDAVKAYKYDVTRALYAIKSDHFENPTKVSQASAHEMLHGVMENEFHGKQSATNLVHIPGVPDDRLFWKPLKILQKLPTFKGTETEVAAQQELWIKCQNLFVEKLKAPNFFDGNILEACYAWAIAFSNDDFKKQYCQDREFKELIKEDVITINEEAVTKKDRYVSNLKELIKKGEGVLRFPESDNHPGLDINAVVRVDSSGKVYLLVIEVKAGDGDPSQFQQWEVEKVLRSSIGDGTEVEIQFLLVRPNKKANSKFTPKEDAVKWEDVSIEEARGILGAHAQFVNAIVKVDYLKRLVEPANIYELGL